MIEQVKKATTAIVEAMHSQPFALALLVINVMFIVLFAYVFEEVSTAGSARNDQIIELLKACAK